MTKVEGVRRFMQMFSFYENGITQLNPCKNVHLCQLIKLTKENHKVEQIMEIRRLREADNQDYKIAKRDLSYVTPACSLRRRDLSAHYFYENFISFSGYIYLDFDKTNIYDVDGYKEYFINKYGDIIAFCAVSSSYGGLSVLVRVSADITHPSEYRQYWQHLVKNHFNDEKVDTKSSDLGRAMYVSYDPKPFTNYDSVVDLTSVQVTRYSDKRKNIHYPVISDGGYQDLSSDRKKKRLIQQEDSYVPTYDFSNVNLKTKIEVINKIVDIELREYNEIRLYQSIPDTEDHLKHKAYTRIIHIFYHLNPNGSVNDIRNILYYINSKQDSKMEERMLNGLIDMVSNEISKEGYVFQSDYRLIHFSDTCGLTQYQKNRISNEINGLMRKNKSIKKIQSAIMEIESSGKKVTKAEVGRVSGLCRTTVNSYFRMEEVDISEVERHFNEDEIKYPRFPDFNEESNVNKKKKILLKYQDNHI